MRIAYFSPVTPLRSGIADYSDALLPQLASLAEVDLFVDGYEPADPRVRERVRCRHWSEFEADHARGRYEAVLYHIGNNPQHVYIYDLALRVPGVLMLHEFNVHYLVAHATLDRNPKQWDTYLAELEHDSGAGARAHGERAQRGEVQPDYNGVPLNRRLIESSRAILVHSDYMVRLLAEAGFRVPVGRVPHGVTPPASDGATARQRLDLDHHLVAGAFGFLKPYKRVDSLIRAFARLARPYPHARLLLVGEEHPHYPLRPLIEELGLAARVHITGFLPLEQFNDSIAASDVCVNLRYPTVGESSGSLLRELAAGKPTVVSDLGAFAELPGDVCLKIPAGDGEVEWLTEYLTVLWNSAKLRESLGSAARQWAATECSWEKVARDYVRFLERVSKPSAEGAESRNTSAVVEPVADSGASRRGGAVSSGELRRYILSWAAANQPLEDYARLHLNRLVRTLEIAPRANAPNASVLEMGCYMQITPALRHYLGYDSVRGCYYGKLGVTDRKTVFSATGEPFSACIDLFDAEKDRYPYADAAFDTVLCCELVEHLYFDPMHMMEEVNRVLKPGGHLVLTTPNIVGLRALHALVETYHPGLFHTYVIPNERGEVDPRHNREYAPRDVKNLFEEAGFEVVRLETDWLDPESANQYRKLDEWLGECGYRRDLRADIIFAVGRKTGPVRSRYPAELYTAF